MEISEQAPRGQLAMKIHTAAVWILNGANQQFWNPSGEESIQALISLDLASSQTWFVYVV